MAYLEIIPIKNIIFIINTFLKTSINIIISEKQIIDNFSSFKKSPLYFLNDLFDALINIPRELINDDIHIILIDELISILDKNLFSSHFNLELNKVQIWFKLLGNKILNLDEKNNLIYPKIISFLVKIYKYHFQNSFYFQNIYEKSAISFDYFINSLDFLWALFREEEKKRTNPEFQIKNGFYIYNNIPLYLTKIKFKINCYSLIFSFKLTKIENNNENIILFSLVCLENKEEKNILKFIINKDNHTLKISEGKNNEWNTGIIIESNKDYLICLSQDHKTFGKEINLFINNKNINDNNLEDKENLYNCYTNKTIGYPDFDQNLTLELGKNNFEGIFGELIIINKLLKKDNIKHLYNLKENYADIICSINYNNDLIVKNKKFMKNNQDLVFFNNLKYNCVLKILTYECHSLLKDLNSVRIKPYGELQYSKNKNNLKLRIYSLNYAIINFPYQHGIEYLIFQLHKIISMSENDELLNFYLYKTLFFVLEYIKMASSFFIFPQKENNKFKQEKKYTVFVLSLIILLNTKQRNLQLDDNIRELLLKFSQIYREKKAILQQQMNISLLLSDKIFKKSDIINYNKLFDEMIAITNINNSVKEKSILNKEIVYKFLLLDDILKSNEIKHKKYMKIIWSIIMYKKNKKKRKKDINININNNMKIFIRYFIKVKDPKKIYHYLKMIYFKIDSFMEFKEFKDYIFSNNNKIINNNSKFCHYIKILCFLIKDILNKDKITKKGNLIDKFKEAKNPDYNFIRYIFINIFNIDTKHKFRFLKSSLYYENEINLLKNIMQNKNFNIFSLFDCKSFIDNLNSIINFYYFLYEQILKKENHNNEIILKKGIKLILDFLDVISNAEEFKKNKSLNNLSDDCIIQSKGNKSSKDNKDISNKSNKNNEKYILINNFINELFSSSEIKSLFILYFKLYKENELKEFEIIDNFIGNTIDKIYNPFYFYIILPNIQLNNNIQKSNYYKNEILKIIINNIITNNSYIYIKGNINTILMLNSIITLIRIYHIIEDNYLVITHDLEKSFIAYFDYLLKNYFIYSKIIFDINLIDNDIIINKDKNTRINSKKPSFNNLKENKNNKFLFEIIIDIIYNLIQTSKNH